MLLKIQSWVKTQVSPLRFRHIQGVAAAAENLAGRYGLALRPARLAAWLHDSGKEMSRTQMKGWLKRSKFKLDGDEKKMPGLWHPHVGAALAVEKWGIKNPSVLEAIRCHTLGKPGMGPLAQVIFVADFIEPGRRFPGVGAARASAQRNLASGVLAKASLTIGFLFEKRMKVHPRLLETWNYFTAVHHEKN